MDIQHWVIINRKGLVRDHVLAENKEVATPEELYTHLHCNYPKFYKMDKLCKWAFVATEYLLGGNDSFYKDIDKSKIAIVLSTSHGCMDVDKRYADAAIPSPALFVYTLPNIMLGELCIRHGFKGEQVCMVNDGVDAGELHFAANTLLECKGMEACLCGYVDVNNAGEPNIYLLWIGKGGGFYPFKSKILTDLHATAN